MKRRRWVAPLVVLGVTLASQILATAAHAQTTLDPNRCEITEDGPDPSDVVGGQPNSGGGLSGVMPPGKTDEKPDDFENGSCSSLLDDIAPGPDPGPVPTSHYDVGHDQGGNCVCMTRRVTGWLTWATFGLVTWIVRIGLGLINWTLDFHVVKMLMPAAQSMSDAYQQEVVGRVGMAPLFLFLCVLWAGFLAFTGRLGRGASEVGVSLLIGAAVASVWSNPAASLNRGLEFTSGVASDIAAVATGNDPATSTDGGKIGEPMARTIHEAFVVIPHQIISWGHVIADGDPCRAVYDQIVSTGPWGTSSKPRLAMKEAGCKKEDAFNRDPSLDRLAAAVFVLVAAILVLALLVLVAKELISAQLGVLVALVLWPFAAPFGALPGRGRAVFWGWVGSTVMEFAKVLMMMLILAMTLIGVSTVLTATESEKLVPRMGIVVLVVVLALAKRKHFLEGTRRAVSNFTSQMSGGRASPAKGGWVNPGLVGVGAGAALTRAQSAYQHHQSNSRQRQLVALSRERNTLDGGRATGATYNNNNQQHVHNLVLIFAGTGGGQNGGGSGPRYDYDAGARAGGDAIGDGEPAELDPVPA